MGRELVANWRPREGTVVFLLPVLPGKIPKPLLATQSHSPNRRSLAKLFSYMVDLPFRWVKSEPMDGTRAPVAAGAAGAAVVAGAAGAAAVFAPKDLAVRPRSPSSFSNIFFGFNLEIRSIRRAVKKNKNKRETERENELMKRLQPAVRKWEIVGRFLFLFIHLFFLGGGGDSRRWIAHRRVWNRFPHRKISLKRRKKNDQSQRNK